MDVVQQLLAAIEADPADEASQMVIADHLQAAGDPRGDLIVLDHAERRGLLVEPEALELLLLLAAEYSFPRAEPDEPPLRWEEIDADTLEAWHAGVRYELRIASCVLRIDRTGDEDDIERIDLDTNELDGRALTVLGDAIRAKTPLDDLRFEFDGVLLPLYDGGPLRCYPLPPEYFVPRGYMRNRFGLAARDYARWHEIWARLDAMMPDEDEF